MVYRPLLLLVSSWLLSACAGNGNSPADSGGRAETSGADALDAAAGGLPDASRDDVGTGEALHLLHDATAGDTHGASDDARDSPETAADAALVVKPGAFAQGIFASVKGDTIPYQLLVPERTVAQERYPLLVFLHGMGELGTDNASQTINFPMQWVTGQNAVDHPAFVLAPQCPPNNSWVDWSYPSADRAVQSIEPTSPTRLALELVDAIVATYPVDPKRIYVTGISLGGEGAFEMVSRRPDLFAAAVPVCGIADSSTADRVKNTAFWVFHGALDDVNPPVYAKGMVTALQAAGAKVKYTEYADLGHEIWTRAYAEPGLLAWLFAQKKAP
jgi:predicted peptidase